MQTNKKVAVVVKSPVMDDCENHLALLVGELEHRLETMVCLGLGARADIISEWRWDRVRENSCFAAQVQTLVKANNWAQDHLDAKSIRFERQETSDSKEIAALLSKREAAREVERHAIIRHLDRTQAREETIRAQAKLDRELNQLRLLQQWVPEGAAH